ncbi:MAG: hypothetical protein ACLP2P_06080 [Desulfobaccales bacterium]
MMQPFDRGVFDKRYDDVYVPAITKAGLEPYRVDRDPSVSIPIEEIESGIRRSEICLAEITTDNPNVWFELGFAIAVPKEVVLICSDERKSNFPFDVQHRNIIKYKTESRQDFDILQSDVSQRILAILNKQKEIDKVSKISPIAETEGLAQHEIVALVTVMQNSFISMTGVSGYKIKEDMNDTGFTDIAVSLALKSLRHKNMISLDIATDSQGNDFAAYVVSSKGEKWLLDNQDKLVLRYEFNEEDKIPF